MTKVKKYSLKELRTLGVIKEDANTTEEPLMAKDDFKKLSLEEQSKYLGDRGTLTKPIQPNQ